MGVGQFVRCLEDAPSRCRYAIPLGSSCFCTNPNRLEIAAMAARRAEAHLSTQFIGKADAAGGEAHG